jgi:hypothetical protein
MPQAETDLPTTTRLSAEAEDPFEKLDDLMAVIEAFAPTWPVRGTFLSTDRFLL